MNSLQRATKRIRSSQTILISCHVNPDGDAIGSMLALGLALQQIGKKPYLFSSDGVPRIYADLPGAALIEKRMPTRTKPFDLAIAVDCSYQHMLGRAYPLFENAKAVLEIDHHEYRESFGTISLVDAKASAMSEVVFPLLLALKIKVTPKIAENLLTSLIVETNSFRLPGVQSNTFYVCSQLLKSGLDFSRLTDRIYWSRSKVSMILLGICLSRSQFLGGDRLVWSVVRQKDFQQVNGRGEDVDAVADELRSIKGVQIAVLFREEKNKKLRVSLRSKEHIDVGIVAKRFGGGGHYDVAGCLIENSSHAIHQLLRECLLAIPHRG